MFQEMWVVIGYGLFVLIILSLIYLIIHMAINDIRNDTLSEYFIWRKEPDGRWVKTADKPLDHLTIKWNGLRTGRFYRRNVWIDEVVYSPHDHTPEWWEDGRGYILVYDPVKKRK